MHYAQGQPIQTGFVAGMEHILGVTQDAELRKVYAPKGHVETLDVERTGAVASLPIVCLDLMWS